MTVPVASLLKIPRGGQVSASVGVEDVKANIEIFLGRKWYTVVKGSMANSPIPQQQLVWFHCGFLNSRNTTFTLPNFNIAPEKLPSHHHHFSGAMLNFGKVPKMEGFLYLIFGCFGGRETPLHKPYLHAAYVGEDSSILTT